MRGVESFLERIMKECCEKYMKEQFGDDAELLQSIYDEYVCSAMAKTDETKKLCTSCEWPALDRVAHTIKGNALAVGDEETAEVAVSLRKAAAVGDAREVSALIERMERLVSEL